MTIRQLPHYARVLTSVRDDIWAIVPEKLIAIRTLLALRAQGQTIDPEEIREVAGSQRHLGDLRIPDGMVSLPTTSEGSETALVPRACRGRCWWFGRRRSGGNTGVRHDCQTYVDADRKQWRNVDGSR